MNQDQRQGVLDNARYLRNVRPVDPSEIVEYVPGQLHPAAVRQVLREHAVELGLRERADGAFVPVDDEPISPQFSGVEAFPERYSRRLEDLLVDEFGPGWPEGASGDRLRGLVRRLKDDYYRQRDVEYDYETALAYAIYHLPAAYAAVQYVLSELGDDGLLSRRARVLDVGAGVGGPALGVHDFYPPDTIVSYHAVEPSDAADVLEHVLGDRRLTFQVNVHRTTAEAFEPASVAETSCGDGPVRNGEYDVVLFANVLSELDDPVAVVDRYLDYLEPDGSLVAIAPADRNTAIHLREVERAFDDDYTVYGPTVRLWPGESPTDRGWTFTARPDLAVPSFQRRLDEAGHDSSGTGEFVNVDVQYAYVVIRTDDRRAVEFQPDPSIHAKMADADEHVTERVDLVALKLSHDLSEGERPLFKVSDGSEAVDHYAVLARTTALNRDLLAAEYGDLLSFENVLVLWNEDEQAYNLVVDGETVVRSLRSRN